jgi:hypothetical protein
LSNNPNEPEDEDEDGFESERLASANQAKHFRDAQERSSESFTSFSEGMPAVDKFKIIGVTGEHPVTKARKKQKADPKKLPAEAKKSVMRTAKNDDNFTSFSEGLPSADKFGWSETATEKLVGIKNFVAATTCHLIKEHAEPDSDGELGDFKSATLDRLMFLYKTVPWSEKICFEISPKPEFVEYCFDEDTIMLDKGLDEEETVVAFAHQSYHATNKLLTKLYDDSEMLDLETFIDLYMWAEVGALITEINVRKELGLWKVAPPKVLCQESDGSLFSITVEEVLKANGLKALHDLLYFSRLRGNDKEKLVDVYKRLFEVYQENFESENKAAQPQIQICLLQGLDRDCI